MRRGDGFAAAPAAPNMITIREVRESDAAALLELGHRLDAETRFLMLEPGERRTDPAEQRQVIAGILAQENSTILVAEDAGRLVGWLQATGGRYRRNRHSCHIVIGILQAYTGQGIGTRLFAALEAWARQHGIHRLELTVMVHNAAAIALYRKQGFRIEGTRVHSLCVDGSYVDEYQMAKLL